MSEQEANKAIDDWLDKVMDRIKTQFDPGTKDRYMHALSIRSLSQLINGMSEIGITNFLICERMKANGFDFELRIVQDEIEAFWLLNEKPSIN